MLEVQIKVSFEIEKNRLKWLPLDYINDEHQN